MARMVNTEPWPMAIPRATAMKGAASERVMRGILSG